MAKLTDREEQALRMVLAGYDAKSIARDLQLSIHTVNESLRSARHKLGVTSSREAARRMAAQDSKVAKNFGDDPFGVPTATEGGFIRQAPAAPSAVPLKWIGPLMLVTAAFSVAAYATLTASQQQSTPPRVIATSPAQGATIAPGPFELQVTFDRPMRPGSYSFVQTDPATYPSCGERPVQSADGRTFTLACRAEAGL